MNICSPDKWMGLAGTRQIADRPRGVIRNERSFLRLAGAAGGRRGVWVLLAEPFGVQQVVGGAVVLAGIVLCRLAMLRR